MGYGAHLIRPRSTAIDPLAEPALMTPLRRPKRSLLPWRPVGYASITIVWFPIFAVAVFGLIVAPVAILDSGLAGASLSESSAFEGEDGALGILIMVVSVAMSLLATRLTRWAKIALMIEFFGFVLNRNSLLVGTAWGYFYVFTVTWLFWPASGAVLGICLTVSALLLALVAVAIWWRRSHIAAVMPKSFRKSVYEYSWPNSAPAHD